MKPRIRSLGASALALACSLPLLLGSVGCEKGGNCQPCREGRETPTGFDNGCEPGLSCSTFSGGSGGLRQLCHKPGVTTC